VKNVLDAERNNFMKTLSCKISSRII